jgi:hypothetical protein
LSASASGLRTLPAVLKQRIAGEEAEIGAIKAVAL